MRKTTKQALVKRKVLFDEYGDYLRCKGKRIVNSRRTVEKQVIRTCGLPSTDRCIYCGEPLCNKCDTTPKRHKVVCKLSLRIAILDK